MRRLLDSELVIVVHELPLRVIVVESIVLPGTILKVLNVALLLLFQVLLLFLISHLPYSRAPIRLRVPDSTEAAHRAAVTLLVAHRVGYQLHSVLQVDIVLNRRLVELLQNWPHVVDFAQRFQEGDVVVQLPVIDIVVPRNDRQRVVRLEEVRSGRVIDYENVSQVAAELRQVLYVHALVEGAVVSRESR